MQQVQESDFDEQVYLIANPDVAEAVAAGRFASGWEHFDVRGRHEGRIFSAPQFVREQGRKVMALKGTVKERERLIAELTRTIAERTEMVRAIQASRTFRAGMVVARAARLPVTAARRVAKLVWWTLTLQLRAQLQRRLGPRLRARQMDPHFSPPKDDFCVAVPFTYPLEQPQTPPRLAVVCHLYYTELLDEFKMYLRRIPFGFDLFVTTDTVEKQAELREGLRGWDHGAVEVRLVPNRGRDIAPKLVACRDVYDRYEFFLHVHSKKSLHADVLSPWRSYLLDTLLGSEEVVRSVFEAFAADPKLGMVAPEHFGPVHGYVGWGWNVRAATEFAGRMGIRFGHLDHVDFPSGSMLWGRSAAIKPLLDLNLDVEDFPPEGEQLDGTLGHVIERLYYFICEKAGYRWIKIVHPGVAQRTHDVLLPADRGELREAIAETQAALLEPRRGAQVVRSARAMLEPGLNQSWRAVHANSELRHLDFATFAEELRKHVAHQDSLIDFDESFYLAAHADVAAEVARGGASCGYVHYCLTGQFENRIYSDRALRRRFGLGPTCPAGALAPVDRAPERNSIVLDHLPDGPKSTLLILFSHLQEEFFFGGYAEFFKDYVPLFERFDRVVLSVQHPTFDKSLAARYCDRIEVIPFREVAAFKYRPTLVVAFNSHLTELAHKMLPSLPERIVYYCQDFEAGFFPLGVDYVIGERAIAQSRNLVVSTELLRKYLQQRGLLEDQNVFVTRPRIEPLPVAPNKTRRLFLYYRPEGFHRRNLPELLKEAVVDFCEKHPGYEIFLVGSVAATYSYKVNGTQVYVLSKLPKNEYVELISSCDVVVSMIYSAHPGIIAFQAAASGIPTVTNTFENRDAALLRRISSNIVPYDPVRDTLMGAIEQALAMPKGQRSFDEALYSGRLGPTIAEFHDTILAGRADEQLLAA